MRELSCAVFEICVPTTEDAVFTLGVAAWVCVVLSAVAIAGCAWYRSDRREPDDSSESDSDTDGDSSSDFDPDAPED